MTIADINAVADPVIDAMIYDITNEISRGNYDAAADTLGKLLEMQEEPIVIIALIGKLRRIVFPGYFRDPAYHVYSAAHSLSMRKAGASRRFAEPPLRSFAAK